MKKGIKTLLEDEERREKIWTNYDADIPSSMTYFKSLKMESRLKEEMHHIILTNFHGIERNCWTNYNQNGMLIFFYTEALICTINEVILKPRKQRIICTNESRAGTLEVDWFSRHFHQMEETEEKIVLQKYYSRKI